jgi:hypothetical protein
MFTLFFSLTSYKLNIQIHFFSNNKRFWAQGGQMNLRRYRFSDLRQGGGNSVRVPKGGGTALDVTADIKLFNEAGNISGGGGGGATDSGIFCVIAGGGAGTVPGLSGDLGSCGATTAGATGGAIGQPGGNFTDAYGTNPGGAAGKAIALNGFVVTIVNGNNPTNIIGLVE